jgi:hypothetical protein
MGVKLVRDHVSSCITHMICTRCWKWHCVSAALRRCICERAGIAVSNDPVLQTRVMAYADAQRYRLGVNYQMLPVNIPVCPFHNNHNDGAMNYLIKDEEV